MRWRFVDKIDSFEPWKTICGKKAASFEECKLLNRLGRDGQLPESIALEACVDQVRRLVEKSSGFRQTALLEKVADFQFTGPVNTGQVLDCSARVLRRDSQGIEAQCHIRTQDDLVARGQIRLVLAPLEEYLDARLRQSIWEEAHGTT